MSSSVSAPYDPTNWYWAVAVVPDSVWSSASLSYVPLDDPTYAAWLAADPAHTTIPMDDGSGMAQVMVQQRLPSYLATGLAITSTATPELNATYALDNVTLDQVGSVAKDVACGLGFPLGLDSFVYPDIASFPHTFLPADFMNLYKALRDYIAAVNGAITLLAQDNFTTFPPQSATIP